MPYHANLRMMAPFYLSLAIQYWIEVACHEWFSHPSPSQIINNLREDPNSSEDYSWKDEVLCYKDRVVLSSTYTLKTHILEELHCSPIIVNSEFQKTYAQASCSLF